ncbi:peptidase C14, caspase domain-containing protein [Desarmillaria tabescens]|uniref:Peptidase C14, caspase domain-containing protein n=1 Tax=Armillaria tabescens TaxID=1929756 RepID=A0AA39KCM5_ARMTA|nr:peptidase C14, caspase domain-containing protein [Desarmillaria tabescens]KAK0458348.1 peptidase C14, caspase domain-containing protein [Desarmillaria tabescens]
MAITPTPEQQSRPPQFWAVLIGIDGYLHTPQLSGCVSDANEMERYLIDTLHVPGNHIQCLLRDDSQIAARVDPNSDPSDDPTRNNIIQTLRNLPAKNNIRKDDKIIIYFAGHGSIYLNSDYYKEGTIESFGCSQALCPSDRDQGTPDIGDRLINDILSKISKDTGAHITVILDCSHSSGITQGIPGAIPHNANPREQDEADFGDTEGKRHTSPLSLTFEAMFDSPEDTKWGNFQHRKSEKWVPNMKSHVLLAACQGYQQAKEIKKEDVSRGVFTKALIEVLESKEWKEKELKEKTYDALTGQLNAHKLEGKTQTSIAIGERKNTQLWSQEPVKQ